MHVLPKKLLGPQGRRRVVLVALLALAGLAAVGYLLWHSSNHRPEAHLGLRIPRPPKTHSPSASDALLVSGTTHGTPSERAPGLQAVTEPAPPPGAGGVTPSESRSARIQQLEATIRQLQAELAAEKHRSVAAGASIGAPGLTSTAPVMPSPLPAMLAAFRAGHLDWHDVVKPSPPPADAQLAQLVAAEHATVALLQGYTPAYTGGRGPWEKHLACPTLQDVCMVHSSVRECVEDELCGWCAPRGLCVDVRTVWRRTPVRGRAEPVCPVGLLVTQESHDFLTRPKAELEQYEVLPLKGKAPRAAPVAGMHCDLVVHRYRPETLDHDGNTAMSYHFVKEYWGQRFGALVRSFKGSSDPRLHFWYVPRSKRHFWEFFNVASDACHRSMDDEAAAGVCYRAKPLDMTAPLVVAQLPGPSTFSQQLGLQVPFGGEGDWQTNQDASLERGLPQVETQAEAERLGALPRGLALDENQLGRSLAKLLKLDTVAQGLTRPVMTLISRRNKRLILNEDELVRVATDMGMEVQLVALESMPLYDQVKAFQRTAVLVGIHGSGLINSIFLPSGAAIVQLMPHGVQKGAAFFKNTALGAGVKYLEWSNPKRDNAVLHWEFVGEDKQGQADSMLQVGDGCCGEGTFFSFWINQDTRVDPADFASILGKALQVSSFKPAEQAR